METNPVDGAGVSINTPNGAGGGSDLSALEVHFGARLSRAEAVRAAHARDEGGLETHPPDAVLFVSSELEMMRALKVLFDPEGLLNPGKIL